MMHSPSHTSEPAPHKDVDPVESNILGISFAMELGALIAVPAVVFGLLGRWLDLQFGSAHLFFFSLLALGFIGSCTAIVRKVREIMAMMPKVLPKKPSHPVEPALAREQEILHDLFRPPHP